MDVRTALAAATLALAPLLGSPPPTPPPGGAEDKPYTAQDGYVRSLIHWHRCPDWGFVRPCPPMTSDECDHG